MPAKADGQAVCGHQQYTERRGACSLDSFWDSAEPDVEQQKRSGAH